MFHTKPSRPHTISFLFLLSGSLLMQGSRFIIMKSSNSRLHVGRTWCLSLRYYPDPSYHYQATFGTACEVGLWNPKVLLKVHVHIQNNLEFRVCCVNLQRLMRHNNTRLLTCTQGWAHLLLAFQLNDRFSSKSDFMPKSKNVQSHKNISSKRHQEKFYLCPKRPVRLMLGTLKTSTPTLDVAPAQHGVQTSTPFTRHGQVPS